MPVAEIGTAAVGHSVNTAGPNIFGGLGTWRILQDHPSYSKWLVSGVKKISCTCDIRYPHELGDFFARVVIEPVCTWDDPQSGGLGAVSTHPISVGITGSRGFPPNGGDHLFMGLY